MARIAMWCPCFVMYNHNQLVIMKKVLMMLCSLLLLACSKEDIPQSKSKQTTPITAELDISADFSGLRALDFKLKNGKVKLDLEGKTEVPVWTAIYPKGSATPLYSKLLMWQIDKDDRTQIHYRGSITLDALNVPLGSSEYTLSAVIVPEDATESYGKHGGGHVHAHILFWDNPNGHKLHPISETEKASISAPYVMLTDLVAVPDPRYGGQRAKLLYNDSQPASARKFKPKGVFFRFKIKNTFDHEVKIKKLRSYIHPGLNGLISTHAGVVISDILYGMKGKTFHPAAQNFSYEDFEFDVPGGVITIPARGESHETFLTYIGGFPDRGVISKDHMYIYRVDAIPSSETTFQEGYCTLPMLTKEPDEYISGKVYDTKLILQRFPNPLTLISKFPLDKTGNNFVKSPTESYTGDYDDTFNSVGYYLVDEAEARFAQAKQYANGGNSKWYIPTSWEMSLIFGDYLNLRRDGSSAPDEEEIQIGQQHFWANAYYKVHSQSGITDIYALRFCELTHLQGAGKIFISTTRGMTSSRSIRGSYFLTDNIMRYAFRYHYDESKKLFVIQAKYVGEDPNITTVDDIQDLSYSGGKIDWSTVSEKLTLPLYGTELAEIGGSAIGSHTTLSPGRPHYGWMAWNRDSFDMDPGRTEPGVTFFSPMARVSNFPHAGYRNQLLFSPKSQTPSMIYDIYHYNIPAHNASQPKTYIRVPVYLFKQLN